MSHVMDLIWNLLRPVQGTVKDMLKLAHKYGLQRPLQACLKFVNENMMDLNMTDNESACIIK